MMDGVETRLDGSTLIVHIPMPFQRRVGRKRIVAPDGSELAPAMKPQPDGTLVKALARAWRWQKLLGVDVYASITETPGALAAVNRPPSPASASWSGWPMPGTTRQSLPGASRYSRADSCPISTYRSSMPP